MFKAGVQADSSQQAGMYMCTLYVALYTQTLGGGGNTITRINAGTLGG